MDEMRSPAMPVGRNRLRFTLRILLCVITASTVLFGLWIAPALNQKIAADRVRAIGGHVGFDAPSSDLSSSESSGIPERKPAAMPNWLRSTVGENRRSVILRERDLSDADAFRNLAQLQGLESLSLTKCKFDPSEIEHLAGCSSLRMLFIGDTSVGDESISSICKLRDLEMLNIARTHVTDASMENVSTLSKLKYLCLVGTAVTDASVPHIAKLKSLEILELHGSAISDAGVKQLRAALPKCNITK